MNYFDDEKEIIEWFQDVERSSVCFLTENKDVVELFESIHNEDKWRLWTNSCGKSDPPPDFYCDELKLMMDVMRVDDHAHKNKKGKLINPTNSRESTIQRELKESGILENFPNVKKIIVNAITDLPTEEDHNYKFYKNNFIRTVEEHKRKLELYKQNHPGHKVIFFVLDESSAYFEAENEEQKIVSGMQVKGTPHAWFLDKSFLQVFENSGIDYFIWYAPFKQEHLFCDLVFPEVAIYDARQTIRESIDYNIAKMVSLEE